MHNQDFGKYGEQYAANYLEQQGYTILETNYRVSYAEVDLIVQKDETIIFVEVKTRSYDFYGSPEEFVTSKKQAMMVFAASQYCEKLEHEGEIRFDIIAIIKPKNQAPKVKHIEDAFFPGLA